MASATRTCAVNKCEIYSCATCHCCQNNLCLDHLKEHKDLLNAKLNPLVNQIDTLFDNLTNFNPTSSSSFQVIEQWRTAAHATVDQFYEHMCHELVEQKKNKPLKRLHTTRNALDQLIKKQGATRENIESLTNNIRSIEQDINNLQNTQINLRPLVIDENTILQSNVSSRNDTSNNNLNTARQETSFQIFVELHTGKQIFIMVKPTDTIMELKRKIQEKEGIPIDQQRLTSKYLGKVLKDEFTVADCDIQKQSTIKVIMRLRDQQQD